MSQKNSGAFEHKDGWFYWAVIYAQSETEAIRFADGFEAALRATESIPSSERVGNSCRELLETGSNRWLVVLADASTSPYYDRARNVADELEEGNLLGRPDEA